MSDPATPAPDSPREEGFRRACRRLADAPLARTSPAELADRFLDGLSDLVGERRRGLMLLDEATFDFELVGARPRDAGAGLESAVSGLIEDGVFANALREARPLEVPLDGGPAASILLVPVATGAVTSGMGLVLLEQEESPTPTERDRLEMLAALLASRLEGRGAWDRASAEIAEQRRIREEKDALNLDLERSIFRLHRLEQQRDDLTRMIVHDLRTPMTSVKTTLDLMARGMFGRLDESEMDLATVAAKSSDRLLGMINDLLDISKFEAGNLKTELGETELVAVIAGVVGSLRPLAEMERKTITFAGPSEPVEVTTDPDLVRRIIENLTGNALRFSPPDSGVTITLTHEPEAFEVGVRDEGEGIPPEYIDRIFEKFVQVEGRDHGRKLGTGLGLTFCQYATQALGGTIRVESEPGEGSTFTVRLPV